MITVISWCGWTGSPVWTGLHTNWKMSWVWCTDWDKTVLVGTTALLIYGCRMLKGTGHSPDPGAGPINLFTGRGWQSVPTPGTWPALLWHSGSDTQPQAFSSLANMVLPQTVHFFFLFLARYKVYIFSLKKKKNPTSSLQIRSIPE